MAKEFLFDEEGRKKILKGAEIIYKAVSTTFSPKGKNVVFETYSNQPPKITKDGVTVAKEILLEDKFENMGATSLKEIALRTVDRVGDGTTTAIILAYNLLKAGIEENELTYKDIDCLKEIADRSVDYLNSVSMRIPNPYQIEAVARIASNDDDEIAKMLKKCVEMLGIHGTIMVEDTKRLETSIELLDGMFLKAGFNTSKSINKPDRGLFEATQPLVLVHDSKINSFYQIKYLLEQIMENSPNNPLIIFSPGLEGDALNGIVANTQNGLMQICAVDITGEEEFVQDLLHDISLFAGCKVLGIQINRPLGVNVKECAQWTDLGKLQCVSVSKERSILAPLDENKENIKVHKRFLETLLDTDEFKDRIEYVRHRLSRCSEGIALLRVGGLTQQSTKERKDRIDDAVCAVHAARRNGIIPGGGLPYIQTAIMLDEFIEGIPDFLRPQYQVAVRILKTALLELVKVMFKYAGGDEDYERLVNEADPSKVDRNKQMTWSGFDLKQNRFGNLHEMGILEPTDVAIETIRSSVAVSALLINSGAFIINSRAPRTDHYNPMDWAAPENG